MPSLMATGHTAITGTVTIGRLATMITGPTATGITATVPTVLARRTGIAAGIIDGTVTRSADQENRIGPGSSDDGITKGTDVSLQPRAALNALNVSRDGLAIYVALIDQPMSARISPWAHA